MNKKARKSANKCRAIGTQTPIGKRIPTNKQKEKPANNKFSITWTAISYAACSIKLDSCMSDTSPPYMPHPICATPTCASLYICHAVMCHAVHVSRCMFTIKQLISLIDQWRKPEEKYKIEVWKSKKKINFKKCVAILRKFSKSPDHKSPCIN